MAKNDLALRSESRMCGEGVEGLGRPSRASEGGLFDRRHHQPSLTRRGNALKPNRRATKDQVLD